MAYNLTVVDTGNTTFDYATMINEALGGHFATFFLFGIFIILMIGFKNYETKTGLMAASVITSVLAALFWGLGFMAMGYIFIPVAVFLVSLVWRGLE